MYRVSHFCVFYGVSHLRVEIQRCGFYITKAKTKDATNQRRSMASIQGDVLNNCN